MSNILEKKGKRVILLAIITLSIFANSCKEKKAEKEIKMEKSVPVVVQQSETMIFEDCVTVSGNIEAKYCSMISARIVGVIDFIKVDEGDIVKKGDVLFKTDSLTLTKVLEVSKKQLDVAKASVREKEVNLERLQVEFEKIEIDYKRYKVLYEDNNAITQDAYEKTESIYKQAVAGLKHAAILIELAEAQEAQASCQVDIAKKDLNDSIVCAPIDGKISKREKEPGEMAEVGTTVLKIIDLNTLEVVANLPGETYGKVKIGKTELKIIANGIDLGKRFIKYKAPELDRRSRTFEVKTYIENPPEGVVPGAIAKVNIILDSRNNLGIPKESLLIYSGKSYVFTVVDNIAKMRNVKTGFLNNGYVEILDNGIKREDNVVIMGQTMLKNGSKVEVVEEDE